VAHSVIQGKIKTQKTGDTWRANSKIENADPLVSIIALNINGLKIQVLKKEMIRLYK
jgi:predicted ATP-grasp superfamily ATP-dependent carboligase